jgi:hypothetical protein
VGYAGELLPLPEKGDIPKGCSAGFITLIKDCWEPFNSKRPSFEAICKTLQAMM